MVAIVRVDLRLLTMSFHDTKIEFHTLN